MHILATMSNDLAALREDISALAKSTSEDIHALATSTREDIHALALSTREDIQSLREENKVDLQSFREETKSDLQSFREETKADLQSLREETKADIHGLATSTKEDFQSLRQQQEATRKDVQRFGVLYEVMQDDIQKVLEGVGGMLPSVRKIPKMGTDIGDIKIDINAIKTAVRATNVDLQNHDRRITKLEAARA